MPWIWIWIAAALLFMGNGVARANEHFSCGEAEVEFRFEAVTGKPQHEDHVLAILTASKGKAATSLLYDGNIDEIGGVCTKNAQGEPMIVFQAMCLGTGCSDLDNWGIIAATDLRVLLVPNDWNRNEVRKILGKPRPEISRMISIGDEAQKLGLY